MNFITIIFSLAIMGTLLLWAGLKWRRNQKEFSDNNLARSATNKGKALGFIVVGSFMLLLVFFGVAVIVVLSLMRVFN